MKPVDDDPLAAQAPLLPADDPSRPKKPARADGTLDATSAAT